MTTTSTSKSGPKHRRRRISHAAWLAEGRGRFGDDMLSWRFACPVCGVAASAYDFRNAGVEKHVVERVVGSSCIGRFMRNRRKAFGDDIGVQGVGDGPCDYTAGGLFKLAPVEVVDVEGASMPVTVFEWAPVEAAPKAVSA